MRARVLQPGRRQAVQVPGWPPRGRFVLPPRLQQLAIGESHQDRVQRAGSHPDLQAQLVAVAPRQRIGRERPENLGGLARRAAVSGHPPKSTYVEIVPQPSPHPRSDRARRQPRRDWCLASEAALCGPLLPSIARAQRRDYSSSRGVRTTDPLSYATTSWAGVAYSPRRFRSGDAGAPHHRRARAHWRSLGSRRSRVSRSDSPVASDRLQPLRYVYILRHPSSIDDAQLLIRQNDLSTAPRVVTPPVMTLKKQHIESLARRAGEPLESIARKILTALDLARCGGRDAPSRAGARGLMDAREQARTNRSVSPPAHLAPISVLVERPAAPLIRERTARALGLHARRLDRWARRGPLLTIDLAGTVRTPVAKMPRVQPIAGPRRTA